MADFPFFRYATDVDTALTDAAAALDTLSMMIQTSDMDCGQDHLRGLCIMLDAIGNVMTAAARDVAGMRKVEGTDTDAYQRGLTKGLEDGRTEGVASVYMTMMELAPDDDASRFFFDQGRAAAFAETAAVVDSQSDHSAADYQTVRQEFTERSKAMGMGSEIREHR